MDDDLTEEEIMAFRRSFSENIDKIVGKIDSIEEKVGGVTENQESMSKGIRILDKLLEYRILSKFRDYFKRYIH